MPENDSGGVLRMDTHVVIYLDLLGSSERIMSKEAQGNLNLLNDIYDKSKVFMSNYRDAICSIPSCHQGELLHDYLKEIGIKVKIFSDNILFAIKIQENSENLIPAIEDVITIASFFQSEAIMRKWLLRGGMTIGKLFIDETFVYGPALVEAVKLEQGENGDFKPPRIVVDDSIIDVYLPSNQKISGVSVLKQDTDSKYYLNSEGIFANGFSGKGYIPYILGGYQTKLMACKREVSEGNDPKKEKILKIIHWAIMYHNSVCDDFNKPSLKIS